MSFTPCLIYINGQLEFYSQTLGWDQPDPDENVATIPGGIIGVAVGPDQTIINLKNVIPRSGRKINYQKLRRAREEISVRMVQIGNQETLEGRFLVGNVSGESASGSPTIESLTLKSVGSPAPIWE